MNNIISSTSAPNNTPNYFQQEAVPALHPPHVLEGNPQEHFALADRSLEEASRLYRQMISENNTEILAPRIRALLGRSRFHRILAEEFTSSSHDTMLSEQMLSLPVEQVAPQNLVIDSPIQHKRAHRLEKLKEKRLEKACINREKALRYKREASYKTRFLQTIQEAGPQYAKDTKEIESKIQWLKNKEDYHTMRARYWEDLAYRNNNSLPGSYHESPVGNYQDEYHVKNSSPIQKAKKAPLYSQFNSLPRAQLQEETIPAVTEVKKSDLSGKFQAAIPTTSIELEAYKPNDVFSARATKHSAQKDEKLNH